MLLSKIFQLDTFFADGVEGYLKRKQAFNGGVIQKTGKRIATRRKMNMRICLIVFTAMVLLNIAAPSLCAETKSPVKAFVTFQDGTMAEVSEPQMVYSWVRSGDTKYINPPVNTVKTKSVGSQETRHGATMQQETPFSQIERIRILFGTPGDTCSLKAEADLKDGKKITEPDINSVPKDVAAKDQDAVFHSLALSGVVQGKNGKSKFLIKLWGAGICPDAKDVVKEVVFR